LPDGLAPSCLRLRCKAEGLPSESRTVHFRRVTIRRNDSEKLTDAFHPVTLVGAREPRHAPSGERAGVLTALFPQEVRMSEVAEIVSLNDDDLDICELEQRLEMTATKAVPCIVVIYWHF
jgi:hypothetical protein